MRVALIGPSQSGKSTLFAAVAEAGGSSVDIHRPDQPHLAVVKVPDERLDWLTELEESKKTTFAELEFFDVPGFDLSDEAGRNRAKTHWSDIRQSDMLVFVVREFEDPAVASYRGRVDSTADVEELLAEMLFADLDQVINRIAKLEQASRKPTTDREENLRELELMNRLQEALESESRIGDVVATEAEQKKLRSFAFLSQKPTLVVRNCDESQAAEHQAPDIGPLPSIRLSAKIELDLAQMEPDERTEFLEDMSLTASARDVLIRACYQRLNLVSFLTAGPMESRAWTVPCCGGPRSVPTRAGWRRSRTRRFSSTISATWSWRFRARFSTATRRSACSRGPLGGKASARGPSC